jgi:CRP-like cAMP-binding protein
VQDEPSYHLDGIGMFSALPGAALRELENACRWRECDIDDVVLERDSDENDVFFIVSGAVEAVSYTVDGDKISLARIEAGDFFGELSAIDGQERSASVIAIEHSLVARMSANRFNQLILVHPELATHLLRRLTQMIRTTNNRIVELSSGQGG